MANPPKRRALGRGLSALMPSGASETKSAEGAPSELSDVSYFFVGVEQIYPDPEQPRRTFNDTLLAELAQSIKSYGIIQPLIVRPRGEGGYTLIAGERRWRASQRAGLLEVPVVVQELDSQAAFERALVENVQRSDLNPIEEANAYERLASDFGYTQQEIAQRVGKKRSTVANVMRLLSLPRKLREWVEDGALSMGHARAILALPDANAMVNMAKTVIAKGLSVRDTESLVSKGQQSPSKTKKGSTDKSPAVKDLERRLTQTLGAETEVKTGRGKSGKVVIKYRDLDDLDRLLEKLKV